MTPIQFLRPYDGWLMWSRCLPGNSIKLLFLSFVRTPESVALLIDEYPRNFSACRLESAVYNIIDIGAA